MSTIAERVAAGAAFLDGREPGWDRRIDLDKLSIGSQCRCILGQLHRSFMAGLMDLDLNEDEDVALGFMWHPDQDAESDEIDRLTAEWKRVITGRRAAS